MKKILLIFFLLLFSSPGNLFADGRHDHSDDRPDNPSSPRSFSQDMRSRLGLPARLPSQDMRSRLKLPVRFPVGPNHQPSKHGHDRRYDHRPVATTVVQEIQPIIVVSPPLPTQPPLPSEPEKVWVPPVTDTRTETGYWDYGIKKTWMGDHWRYEQDPEQRVWVPESQIEVVTQAGYWKIVE